MFEYKCDVYYMGSDNFCLSMFFTKMLLLYWLVGGIQRRPDWRYVKLNSPQFYTVTVHKTQLALRQRNLKICLYHTMWLANSINLITYREQKRNNRVQQCKKTNKQKPTIDIITGLSASLTVGHLIHFCILKFHKALKSVLKPICG